MGCAEFIIGRAFARPVGETVAAVQNMMGSLGGFLPHPWTYFSHLVA
jgi:hypothetical protein